MMIVATTQELEQLRVGTSVCDLNGQTWIKQARTPLQGRPCPTLPACVMELPGRQPETAMRPAAEVIQRFRRFFGA